MDARFAIPPSDPVVVDLCSMHGMSLEDYKNLINEIDADLLGGLLARDVEIRRVLTGDSLGHYMQNFAVGLILYGYSLGLGATKLEDEK